MRPRLSCLRPSCTWIVASALGGLAVAEEPPPTPPPSWSDVAAFVRQPDAPLLLHLRIEADGRLALRSRLAGEPAWVEQGVSTLAGEPAADMAALRALHATFARALAWPGPPAGLRGPDGYSLARLIVDAAPEALWRHVQWALAVACAPPLKVWRLSFLGSVDAPRLDLDLPKDRSGPGEEARGATRVTVKLFRKEAPAEPAGEAPDAFTRVRFSVAWVPQWPGLEEALEEAAPPASPAPRGRPQVLDGGRRPGEAAGGEARAPAEPKPAPADPADGSTTVDLPPSRASAQAHAGGHEHLRAAVARAFQGARGERVAEVRAPPPSGLRVPAGDVVRVMGLLRAAGVSEIQLEGAAAPLARKDGGGWSFESPR